MPVNPLLQAYSAGAVGFDTRPFLNHYLNLQAKKEARNQSIDNYYRDQMNSLTPTGVRDQDMKDIKQADGTIVPGWRSRYDKFVEYGIANKDKLRKGDYDAVSTFNRLKNELKATAEESKAAAQDDKTGFEYRKSFPYATEGDFEVLNNSSKSIFDPSRNKDLNINSLSFAREPLDVNKFLTGVQQGYNRGTQMAKPDLVDDKNGLRTAYTHDIYSPDNLKAMANKAAFTIEAKGNRSPEWSFFEHLRDSHDLPKLQEVYSKYFPQGGLISTPAQAAAAYTLLNSEGATNESTKTTEYESPQSKRNWDLYMEGVRQKNRERLKAMKGAGEGEDGDAYDIVDVLFQDAKNNPRTYKTADGKTSIQYEASVSPEIAKMFAFKDGDNEIKPDAFRFSQDGKYFTSIFYKYKDGEVLRGKNGMVSVDEKISRPILTDLLRANQGKKNFGTKENKAIMSASKKKTVKPTKGMFD